MNKPLRAVDLFCGGGGLSQGLSDAGIQIICAMDAWPAAINFYRANQGNHPAELQDLSDVEGTIARLKQLSFEMIVGGPPCQDFSSAGKRDGNGSRANLTRCYAQIVCALKPPYFLMENVDLARKYSAFRESIDAFRAAGYGLTECVLDASLCGVPQKRKRTIVVGILGGANDALIPLYQQSFSERPLTIRQAFGNAWPVDFYYRHPRSYARRGIFSIDEPSPTIRGVNRPIPKGYQRRPNDPADPSTVRPLTTRERALLQTFPPHWRLIGKKSDLEQIIGNAVPVKLAHFVGAIFLAYLNANGDPQAISPVHISPHLEYIANEFYHYAPYEEASGQVCCMET